MIRRDSPPRPGLGPRARRSVRGTFAVIAAAYMLIAATVTTAAVHVLHDRSAFGVAGSTTAAVTAPPKYLVLMVLDGARPDYFNLTKLPHFDALRAQGTTFTNSFDGILEAETPAGHATIATGGPPSDDGIFGFDWGVGDSDRYSLFNADQMSNVEQILQQAHVPSIAGLYKAKFPQARAVALSGHKYYAATPLGGPEADAIVFYEGDAKGRYVPAAVPGHEPPPGILTNPKLIYPTIHTPPGAEDTLATKMDLALFQKMHQRINLINYPEFDWPLGHVFGGIINKPKVIQRMQDWDKDLGMIEDAYRKAGILNQTLFVITSDHGMMPIKRYVPSSEIDDAISAAGTSAPDITYDSGNYIWLSDPTKAQTVAQNIVNINDPGIQSVYYLSTQTGTPQYVQAGSNFATPAMETANQYLLKTLINGKEPAVVIFGTEGTTFSSTSNGWKGDHGGNSWQSEHNTLFISGPGIKAGVTVNTPAQLEDIAPTVLTDMGVQPTGMHGHVLTEAMVHATTGEDRARQAEIKQVTPVVDALLTQEKYDIAH
ncbi:MAG TPA: alkaline phosphatase family protein [Chloroflexota bacterium]|nr:alkaline phosphatase family protein [Chloroflexota bacterium]